MENPFAGKVEQQSNGCVLWKGKVNNNGYGKIGKELAHRVSYQYFKGEIPPGLHVLHHCDTPACVSPSHLFLGTHKENMLDMHAKGRRPKNYNKGKKNALR